MLKRVIILLIVLVIAFGCAKKSTELKEHHVLNRVSSIPMVGNPVDLDAADSLVYIAEDQGGVSIVNLNNFTRKWYPAFYGDGTSLVNLTNIRKIVMLKSLNTLLAYGTFGSDMIKIVNTSNLDSLRITGGVTGGTSTVQEMIFKPITSAGNLFPFEGLLCGLRTIGYGKYGLHDPETPPFFSFSLSFDTPADVNGVFLTDQYIFAAMEQLGLYIYDRTNGSLVGKVDLPGEAQKVKVVGNHAFVTCRQDGLQIVDITNPAAPAIVGSIDTSGYATHLDTWGNYVVVGSGGSGVYVFDVTNPAIPILKDHITDCGYINSVKYHDNKILVASRDQGLLVYSIIE